MGGSSESTRWTPRRTAGVLVRWFAAHARDLPWRTPERDPWRALVSEIMLQQTQVSRVADRYPAFVERFPTPRAMAAADEGDVLALWSGLGYYRRARALHAAARAIAHDHAGVVPADVRSLASLPGVGRYTAGAIASMVFGLPEPAVDGNVIRVLLRLHASDRSQDAPATRAWAESTARELAEATDDPGALAEALMELGATVCTPKSPTCEGCPVRAGCRAFAEGRQHEIPAPKARKAPRDLFCASVVSADARGRLLVEQRPDAGMWGGLWQAPTLERDDRTPNAAEVRAFVGARSARRRDTFVHQTTHRTVRFEVWLAEGARAGAGRERRTPGEIAALGLSNPQRRILLGTPTA
ncbi:MAG: A/G-specific adenine glycosylase [Phycisphaerales bacterium]